MGCIAADWVLLSVRMMNDLHPNRTKYPFSIFHREVIVKLTLEAPYLWLSSRCWPEPTPVVLYSLATTSDQKKIRREHLHAGRINQHARADGAQHPVGELGAHRCPMAPPLCPLPNMMRPERIPAGFVGTKRRARIGRSHTRLDC